MAASFFCIIFSYVGSVNHPRVELMSNTATQTMQGTRSIVVFTLHKSASMLIHNLCNKLSQDAGIQYVSPNLAGSGVDARVLLSNKEIWRSHNTCFAPVRFYVDIPNMDDYQIILHLRDPRDVLVSMYYSYCFIHEGEVKGNTGYRKEIADQGIDHFVLHMANEQKPKIKGDYGTGAHVADATGNLLKRYSDYIDNVLSRGNTTLVKYEEMVTDFPGWLEKFVAPFPLKDKKATVSELVALTPQIFPVRTQDAMHHVRHITPGDHKNKLKAETIDELNHVFRDVLCALDYK